MCTPVTSQSCTTLYHWYTQKAHKNGQFYVHYNKAPTIIETLHTNRRTRQPQAQQHLRTNGYRQYGVPRRGSNHKQCSGRGIPVSELNFKKKPNDTAEDSIL